MPEPEPSDPENVLEIEELYAAMERLTEWLTAATLEIRKETFRINMQRLEREEIAALERWYAL